jgi:quinolinate synthase
MFAVPSITEEILDLKRQWRAMIFAHHYRDSEIQEIADAIGDSLELSHAAQKFHSRVMVAPDCAPAMRSRL